MRKWMVCMLNKQMLPKMTRLLFVLLTIGCTAIRTNNINFTNVLYQYILYCGFDYICEPDTGLLADMQLPLKPTGYGDIELCPKCNCGPTCRESNDCCPDVLFRQHDMTCMNFAILLHSDIGRPEYGLIIDTCPENTTDEVKNQCSGNYNSEQKLTLPPVSSSNSVAIYRNKFCAECNGEQDTKVWKISINCQDEVDLNHLNSYDEILRVGGYGKCDMTYTATTGYFACSFTEGIYAVDRCNMSGTWQVYDPDIAWGCEANFLPFHRRNKNVFCYMCNPDTVQRDAIASCNQTGVYQEANRQLEDACELYSESKASFPYKNVFCYLCNRNNFTVDPFMDGHMIPYVDEDGFRYSLRFDKLHFRLQNNKNTGTIAKFNFSSRTDHVDIDKLLRMHFLHYGYQEQCDNSKAVTDKSTDPNMIKQCSCEIGCIYREDCCAHFALTDPISFSELFNKSPLMVDRCYGEHIMELRNRCENETIDDGLQVLPVTSSVTDVLYKNVYCFLCNEDKTRDYIISTVDISCKNSKLIHRYIVMKDFVFDVLGGKTRYTNNHSCTVVLPDEIPGTYDVSSCDNASVSDPDVIWACEHYYRAITPFTPLFKKDELYKSMFCKLCNINPTMNPSPISECNTTGHWDTFIRDINDACVNNEAVQTLDPYKNIFCIKCNPQRKTSGCSSDQYEKSWYPTDPVYNIESEAVYKSTYRYLFSMQTSLNSPSLLRSKHNARCGLEEYYDDSKDKCKQLTCPTGKFLRGDDCVPFLPQTSNLGFTFVTALQGNLTLTERNATAAVLIGEFKTILNRQIANMLTLETESIDIVSLYISIPLSCDVDFVSNKTEEVIILLHISFYIPVVVNRDEIEGALINMTRDPLVLLAQSISMKFRHIKDISAYYLPSMVYQRNLGSQCVLAEHKKLTFNQNTYKLSVVNKLLMCTLVEIDEDQFELVEMFHEINILPDGPVLKFGEFQMISHTRVFICIKDFIKIMTNVKPVRGVLETMLGVLSFACICLSMLGLILTFLTYCFFSSLRTLPGKNNMCLVVALFLSQGLTRFGLGHTDDATVCTILAYFLHYFWLATFFCMNVCSLHMFRAFVYPFESMKDKSMEMWIFFRYVCYSFGTPAAIIILHSSISYSITGYLGYGGPIKCFLTTFEAIIGSFIAPIVLVCILNVVFFSITAHKIRTAPRVASNKSDRQEFPVYVKLFVLTGVTWIVQIVESFFPLSAFSIVVSVLNASQGVFIFISYSVNERVRTYYRSGLSKTFSTRSTDNANPNAAGFA